VYVQFEDINPVSHCRLRDLSNVTAVSAATWGLTEEGGGAKVLIVFVLCETFFKYFLTLLYAHCQVMTSRR